MSQWGHGTDQDNAAIKAYNSGLVHPVRVERSPVNAHALNGCEPLVKCLYYVGNMIVKNWDLGSVWGPDAVVGAGEMVNDLPSPFARSVERRKLSPYELFYDSEASGSEGGGVDGSRWVATTGQPVWVHVPGAKANERALKAREAIFLFPLPCAPV